MVFVCHRTVSDTTVYQLKIQHDQDKFRLFFVEAKRPVRFPLEDQHVVNEHHVVRKSHDATQKRSPRVVHFNVTSENSRHLKRYSEGGTKIRGRRSLWGRVIKCNKNN